MVPVGKVVYFSGGIECYQQGGWNQGSYSIPKVLNVRSIVRLT